VMSAAAPVARSRRCTTTPAGDVDDVDKAAWTARLPAARWSHSIG
jgi:hypothetical protein